MVSSASLWCFFWTSSILPSWGGLDLPGRCDQLLYGHQSDRDLKAYPCSSLSFSKTDGMKILPQRAAGGLRHLFINKHPFLGWSSRWLYLTQTYAYFILLVFTPSSKAHEHFSVFCLLFTLLLMLSFSWKAVGPYAPYSFPL